MLCFCRLYPSNSVVAFFHLEMLQWDKRETNESRIKQSHAKTELFARIKYETSRDTTAKQ